MEQRVNGQFAPGVSGNPSGRPKSVGAVRDLAREQTAAAIGRLVELMASRDEWVALRAAEMLLDRGWGKPAQSVAIDATVSGIGVPEPITPHMTAEQAAAAYVATLTTRH